MNLGFTVFSEPRGALPAEFVATLTRIRDRPDMYFIGGANVSALEAFLHGYQLGGVHCRSDLCLGLGAPFSRWLTNEKKMKGSASVAWSAILRLNTDTEQRAFESFFPLFEEFRNEKTKKKTAEPGATDNPDDAQRLREDY